MPSGEVRLVCSVCGMNSIPAPEGAGPKTKYVCKPCNAGKQPAEQVKNLGYDRFAFNLFGPSHFRIVTKPRTGAPEWSLKKDFLLRVSNGYSQDREMIARRFTCLDYYYRCAWESADIAEELGMTIWAVEDLVKKFTRRAEKLWSKEKSSNQ